MYQEILRLHRMLEKAGIPHEFTKIYDGHKVLVDCIVGKVDAVEHEYVTNNGAWDLVEIMGGLTKDEERECSMVLGGLTAKEAFRRFRYCHRFHTTTYGREDDD